MNVIVCFSKSDLLQFQCIKVRYLETSRSEMIESDILKLKKKQCTDFLIYNNNCFFTDCEKMKPVVMSSGTYYFLFYKKKELNFLRLYQFISLEEYVTTEIIGYNPELLWRFYDTCNVRAPKCNDWVNDDGCDSYLYCYKDTTVKKYYFSKPLLNCTENSYTLFINMVSESIKQHVFASNRYNVKKIYGRKYYKVLYDFYKKNGCID